jgi:hypothetical protein
MYRQVTFFSTHENSRILLQPTCPHLLSPHVADPSRLIRAKSSGHRDVARAILFYLLRSAIYMLQSQAITHLRI